MTEIKLKFYDYNGYEIEAPITTKKFNDLLKLGIIPRRKENIYFEDDDYELIIKNHEEGMHFFDIHDDFVVDLVCYYPDGHANENKDDCFLIAIYCKYKS